MRRIGTIDWLLWILYFLVPSEGGIIGGVPIGTVETLGLLCVAWIALHHARIGGARIAATVAVLAAIASAAVPGEPGLRARYFPTATAAGNHERSTENRDRSFTRVDGRLAFTRGQHDFPLAFFNDHTRFNFIGAGQPDRRYLPFAVAWTGWWWSDGGTQSLYLHSPGATAEMLIDASPILSGSGDQSRDVEMSRGWHRLHVSYSSPTGGPREFSAGEVRNGRPAPFDRATLRTDRIDGRQTMVATALKMLKPVADVMVLACLLVIAVTLVGRRLGEVWQGRLAAGEAALWLFAAAGAIEALRFAWPWADRLRIMVAGDDTMVYEAYARDIQLNGILMTGGAPLGHAEPFYYQAFYPYFLAGSHALFGESFFGALFLQRLFVVLTVLTLTRIAMQLRGQSVWPVALAVSALFAWWKFAPIAADMLSESLYIPLLVLWTAASIDSCRRPTVSRGVLAGILGGVATITRSTALLAWPPVWAVNFIALRGRRRVAIISVMAACSIAIFSLIALRNWIAANTFAPTSSEFGITLLGGNPPPPGLVTDSTPRQALYARFDVGGATQEVIEFALAAPGAFAGQMGRKALFALGVYEPYAEGWGISPVYIATWISAVAGVILLWRRSDRTIVMLVPLIVAVTQYVAVVIVYPKGERLILPVHTLLVPYAAVAAYELWQRANNQRHRHRDQVN